ncbi:FAD-dependent oxidoreductase [Sulfurimonas sp. MAG313]|nr:FAD-dependent oxidoreductase [Sulfurimonas sp. MAG313]MDF1880394.1 FAD-dependent oxidoreductase [Sulfurimonas sp. MAG313]
MQKKRVVIIGGGYGGIRVMQRLSKVKELEVFLFDQNTYHYLQTEAYAFIANTIKITDVTVELRSLCETHKNASFINAEVTKVDLKNKSINYDDKTMSYDYIVIATGSKTAFPDAIKGLRDHAFGVKALSCAFKLKQHFAKLLYDIMQRDNAYDDYVMNVVIGGAGLSGVEIAAEMAHYSNAYMQNNHMLGKGIHVHLIASRENVLDGMDPYLQKVARQRLEELGVNILFKTRISELKEEKVILNNGESIDFNFMIFTGGVNVSALARSLDCKLSDKGSILVEHNLNLEGYTDAFAIGDVALIKDQHEKVVPNTAQTAEKTGDIVATNIKALLKGKKTKVQFMRIDGVLVALGGKHAAVTLFDTFKISGYIGYLLKSFITWQYKVQLDLEAKSWYKQNK